MQKRWVLAPKVSDDLSKQLLANRNITTASEIEKFLHPHLNLLTKNQKLFPQKKKAVARIVEAIKKKEPIYIYGDYDVDGITGCAILWETIDSLGGKVLPYIPSRHSQGYGLHSDALKQLAKDGAKVVVSVDCGITAVEQAKVAKELEIDLIITDHHQPLDKLPEPFALLHTTSLAGSGIAFRLAEELLSVFRVEEPEQYFRNLELATLGTVADMVPLVGDNRIIVKNGLTTLEKTKRLGLKALYEEASVSKVISTYEIGFVISPRLNAMGRLDSAMDSLRLLLTRNKVRATQLAQILGKTNKDRQQQTIEVFEDARKKVVEEYNDAKFIIVDSQSYPEGVVGLVASRLVESFYRPVAVIGKGEKAFKGSARSVSGFNITEAIHTQESLLVSHGGHAMAAGFSIEEKNIPEFRDNLVKLAADSLSDVQLTPVLRIDLEITLYAINEKLEQSLKEFAPFGIGNPEPTFLTKKLKTLEVKVVGKDKNHIKLKFQDEKGKVLEGIGFDLNSKKPDEGDIVDIAYNIRENYWNSRKHLEARIKDIRKTELN